MTGGDANQVAMVLALALLSQLAGDLIAFGGVQRLHQASCDPKALSPDLLKSFLAPVASWLPERQVVLFVASELGSYRTRVSLHGESGDLVIDDTTEHEEGSVKSWRPRGASFLAALRQRMIPPKESPNAWVYP